MCDWEFGTWDPAVSSSFDCFLRHQSTYNAISWLAPPPCQMQPNFDVFDHQMKVKVAEIFWGASAPQGTPLGVPHGGHIN